METIENNFFLRKGILQQFFIIISGFLYQSYNRFCMLHITTTSIWANKSDQLLRKKKSSHTSNIQNLDAITIENIIYHKYIINHDKKVWKSMKTMGEMNGQYVDEIISWSHIVVKWVIAWYDGHSRLFTQTDTDLSSDSLAFRLLKKTYIPFSILSLFCFCCVNNEKQKNVKKKWNCFKKRKKKKRKKENKGIEIDLEMCRAGINKWVLCEHQILPDILAPYILKIAKDCKRFFII